MILLLFWLCNIKNAHKPQLLSWVPNVLSFVWRPNSTVDTTCKADQWVQSASLQQKITMTNYCFFVASHAPKTTLLNSDNPTLSHSNDSLAGNWALLEHNALHITTTEINTRGGGDRISLCCNSVCCILCKRACSKLAIYFFCNNGFFFPTVFVYLSIYFLLVLQLEKGAQ